MHDAGPKAPADDPGLLASSATTLRLIAGWTGAALAVLNLSMGVDVGRRSTDASYLLFHVVLLITGGTLLGRGRLRRTPDGVGWAAGGLVAGLGPVLGALPRTTVVCCLLDHPVRHGFPFTMLARGADGWHADPVLAVVDVLFWCCVGFLGTTLLTLVRGGAPARHRATATPPRHATHAEDRAAERPRTPHDENVGGLP